MIEEYETNSNGDIKAVVKGESYIIAKEIYRDILLECLMLDKKYSITITIKIIK